MLQFLPGYAWFAIAGAAAASGPIVIHLLNRRRFRIVHWAAMDFLREAIRRNRRILELRDMLLLVLRTLAVLLFGLALARPFVPADATISWRIGLPVLAAAFACGLTTLLLRSQTAARTLFGVTTVALLGVFAFFAARPYWQSVASGGAGVDPSQPLHAIIIVDNSLSMSYARERSLLDDAKARALKFIDRLPEGSQIAVLPLCGPDNQFNRDPYPDKQDARAALDRIVALDRRGTAADAVALALDAATRAPDFPPAAKRIVLIGDQQQINWPVESLADQIGQLPEFQVVDVSAADATNTFVASVDVEDGLADTQTPAKITTRIRHSGREERTNVQVSLWADGAEVATQTIDKLEPNSDRELVFHHQFASSVDPGRVRYVPVKVSLPADRLPMDDARYIAVPVVSALSVVFVDQLGAEGEQPARAKFGETRQLRKMLHPSSASTAAAGDAAADSLVRVKHVTIDQVDRKLLSDARLVVVAGVAAPGASAVKTLREYVEQGGQLILAAGGQFDAARWQTDAWQSGGGILPLPLDGVVGRSLDEEANKLDPFYISYESLAGNDEFHIAGETPESHAAFYRDPWFFKAIRVNAAPELIDKFVAAERTRLEREQAAAAAPASNRTSSLDAKEIPATAAIADAHPAWLAWHGDIAHARAAPNPASEARRLAPRVLARFTNGLPFLAERRIGAGSVLFIATSVYSSWNTWPASYTMFLADRLMRRRIERTLPQRNVPTDRDVPLAVDANDVQSSFTLTRPDGGVQIREAEALDAQSYGVTIEEPCNRGVYQLALRVDPDPDAAPISPDAQLRWKSPVIVAANGPAEESELAAVGSEPIRQSLAAVRNFRWVAPGE
jgi:hypothetical protein